MRNVDTIKINVNDDPILEFHLQKLKELAQKEFTSLANDLEPFQTTLQYFNQLDETTKTQIKTSSCGALLLSVIYHQAAQKYVTAYGTQRLLDEKQLKKTVVDIFNRLKTQGQVSGEDAGKLKQIFQTLKREIELLEKVTKFLTLSKDLNAEQLTKAEKNTIKNQLIKYQSMLADVYFDCYAALKGKMLNRRLGLKVSKKEDNKPFKLIFNQVCYQQYQEAFDRQDNETANNNNNQGTQQRLAKSLTYLKQAKHQWKELYNLSSKVLYWRQYCYALEQRGHFAFREWSQDKQEQQLQNSVNVSIYKLAASLGKLFNITPISQRKAQEEHVALHDTLRTWQQTVEDHKQETNQNDAPRGSIGFILNNKS